MRIDIEKKQDELSLHLAMLVSRGKSVAAYLNRIVVPQIHQKQLNRWSTQNRSEGPEWAPLTEVYAKRKPKIYKDFPGGGKALMIATGTLSQAATGQDKGEFKEATNEYLIMGINTTKIPYAGEEPGVATKRPYMKFSKKTEQEIMDGLVRYLATGKEK